MHGLNYQGNTINEMEYHRKKNITKYHTFMWILFLFIYIYFSCVKSYVSLYKIENIQIYCILCEYIKTVLKLV